MASSAASASHVQKDDEYYALLAQRLWRGFKGRIKFRCQLEQTVLKYYDEDQEAYYYYNQLTGESSWEAPKVLGS